MYNGIRKMNLQFSLRRFSILTQTLSKSDPELAHIIDKEKYRQQNSISLIASENTTSNAVHEALSSCMSNKYSEGLPGARYYGGNKWIDEVETLCMKRALDCFNLDPNEWGVNVQPLSGSPANFQVYTALLKPGDKLMGLDLSHGGHLSHGFVSPKGKQVSATSRYFKSESYSVDDTTGLIDMNKVCKKAADFNPQLIIAGVSAYPRLLNYARFREICNTNNSYLLADMAHISGLVAAKCIPSPFPYADVVTTTTHKTLRGPRGAMIFYRKKAGSFHSDSFKKVSEKKINDAVFPGLQGGPHNHTIAALATALNQTKTTEFVQYQNTVLNNARFLAGELQLRGYSLLTDGTDCHMMVVDLRRSEKLKNLKELDVDGSSIDDILDKVQISVNKNTVPGDRSAVKPYGVRIGTASVTSRGCNVTDMIIIAEIFDRAVDIVIEWKTNQNETDYLKNIEKLRCDVNNFISSIH